MYLVSMVQFCILQLCKLHRLHNYYIFHASLNKNILRVTNVEIETICRCGNSVHIYTHVHTHIHINIHMQLYIHTYYTYMYSVFIYLCMKSSRPDIRRTTSTLHVCRFKPVLLWLEVRCSNGWPRSEQSLFGKAISWDSTCWWPRKQRH